MTLAFELTDFDIRLADAAAALAAAPVDHRLSVFQSYAIRLYAVADVEDVPRGVATEALEEIAQRHQLVHVAGGQDALQHVITEAAQGRRSIYEPNGTEPLDLPLPLINGELSTVCVADVKSRPIDWLWAGRIARGKPTLLAGYPDIGKSQIAIDISARLSREGLHWPDGGGAPVCSTLMLSAEDAIADTIRPRYEAAGGDLTRLHVATMVTEKDGRTRSFNLQEDLSRLRTKISAIGNVGLVIADPITSYMGRVDSHRTTDVRAVLEPFSALADETNVAVLAVTHPPKGAQSNALNAFTGSLAYVAAARLAFLAIEEADTDRRLLLPVKNNIGPRAAGLGYRLEQTIVGSGIVASRVCWDNAPVTVTANDAVRMTSAEEREARKDAKDLLRDQLADGPRAAADVERMATDLGISDRTLRRARKDLGVVSKKDAFAGGWSWSLLPEGGQGVQDGHSL